MHRYKLSIGILIVLSITLAILVPLAITSQKLFGKAASQTSPKEKELIVYTNELKQSANRNKFDSTQMIPIAKARKEILISLAQQPNNQYNAQILSVKERGQLIAQDSTLNDLLEMPVTLEGKLYQVHMDNFENGSIELQTILTTTSQSGEKVYRLYSPENQKQNNNSQVRVQGLQIGADMLVQKITPLETPQKGTISQSTIQIPAPNHMDMRKTHVVMIDFENITTNPDPDAPYFTAKNIQEYTYDAKDSVNQAIKEFSYGTVSIAGEVWGPYKTSQSQSNCNKDHVNWINEANARLTQDGFPWDNYDNLIYLWRHAPDCKFAGTTQTFGKITLINGIVSPGWFKFATLHELGHSFGYGHASTLVCPGKAIDVKENCTVEEYGNYYDTMGLSYQSPKHFGAYYKLSNGENMANPLGQLISSDKVISVANSGTYTLSPYEILDSSSTTPLALQIAKPDTDEVYYVEYRTQKGFDTNLTEQMTQGAIVQLAPKNYVRGSSSYFLLDTHPETDTFLDASLSDGSQFVDNKNGITIKQISHNASQVVIQIIVNTPQIPIPSPVTYLRIEQKGTNVRLTWKPTKHATSYSIYRKSYAINTNTNLYTKGPEIGQTQNTEFIDTIPNAIGNPNEQHFYIVTARNAQNKESQDSVVVGEFDYDVKKGTYIFMAPIFDLKRIPDARAFSKLLISQGFTQGNLLKWEPKTQQFRLARYQNTNSSFSGENFPIQADADVVGFVSTGKTGIFTMTGELPKKPPTVTLIKGKNMIAMHPTYNFTVPVAQTLGNLLIPYVDRIYDSQRISGSAMPYISYNGTAWENDPFIMHRGYGYFIDMNQKATWTYPN